MQKPFLSVQRSVLWILAVAGLSLTGCGEPEARFDFNTVYLAYQQNQINLDYAPTQKQDIADAIESLFGTPDDPFLVPGVDGLAELVDIDRVRLAAGPVHSDQYGDGAGLYRQHCVHCHGITGNGRGPTAEFLNPYPRDFTKGQFKFKSTPIGIKPTHDDLKRILMNGIAGTAMPSFALLSEGEVDTLVEYVKFLAIRGEVERKLIEYNPDFYDAEAPEENESLRAEFLARDFLVDEVLNEVVESWSSAEEMVTEVPERPSQYDRNNEDFSEEALSESVQRGKTLYYTSVANCYSCHGPSQLGDGQITDYDQWTKEFFDWTKKNDENYPARLKQFLAAGGLKPRNILPRNLRKGIYRGGRRPIDIYWRVHNGIDGSPMPAANKAALSDDDIWDIVNYVIALPYEPASRPDVVLVNTEQVVN